MNDEEIKLLADRLRAHDMCLPRADRNPHVRDVCAALAELVHERTQLAQQVATLQAALDGTLIADDGPEAA